MLSFILTGVGGYLIGGSNDYAAKVNGQEISRAQLEQSMQSERSRLQQQLGEQFSVLAGNEGYMQQLRQQILGQLINNMLLDQYAKQLGLSASDEQVKDSIRQLPYFQTDNKFDNNKYLELVNRMGYTPPVRSNSASTADQSAIATGFQRNGFCPASGSTGDV